MSCSNCYNGCTEIVSDKCVRYTGIDVPILGIKTGDSLSYIEQALIEFLTATIDGRGIIPIIDPEIICDIVNNNLPTCGAISLNEILTALIKSTCSLQTQIGAINSTLDVLNGDYTIGCLSGVTSVSDTHAVLQAVITKLCATDAALGALAVTISATYVRLDQLDILIQQYLDSQSSSTSYYNKMVPYTVVEYYGSLTGFDLNGIGSGVWEKVYLCNGLNNTPDKRGRSPIGATQGVGGGPFDPQVDPTLGNPTYALKTTNGVNAVSLAANQLASHTHTAVASIVDPGHTHAIQTYPATGGTATGVVGTTTGGTSGSSPSTTQNITNLNTGNVTVTVNPQGSGAAHNNVHPVISCYYIMYIPS